MAEVVHKIHPEYWVPSPGNASLNADPFAAQLTVCGQCGTEFLIGSRFCHVCGQAREQSISSSSSWLEALDFFRLRDAMGLSTASAVGAIVGVLCLAVALSTGFIFNTSTVLDWQAVQLWRIEWTLGAIAAFLFGLLLKRSD